MDNNKKVDMYMTVRQIKELVYAFDRLYVDDIDGLSDKDSRAFFFGVITEKVDHLHDIVNGL